MSSKWNWTLIVALFFAAGVSLTFLGEPPDQSGLSQAPPAETGDPGRSGVDDGAAAPAAQAAFSPGRPSNGPETADDKTPRMYSPDIARHHLVNPLVRLECENPDDSFDCRLEVSYDHPYYDARRFDTRTLETLADNYDAVAALVLAQRFGYEPDKRTQRFIDAATYSGRAGPLVIMVRDFENDPTDLASVMNRCKYLYVATWMDYPFDAAGRILASACERVEALGGDPQSVRQDAETLFSQIKERRRATVGAGAGPDGGVS